MDIRIQQVLIAALLVLPSFVLAHVATILHFVLVKDLRAHMPEAPVFKGEMRNRILPVSHSRLEVVLAVDLVEPSHKLGVTDPGRAK